MFLVTECIQEICVSMSVTEGENVSMTMTEGENNKLSVASKIC